MQATEADNKVAPRVEEESINFRPSPNFKHMKKYLKSKFEEMNSGGTSEVNNEQEKQSSNLVQKEEKESQIKKEQVQANDIKQNTTVANTDPQPTNIQPPLPPNPPPEGPLSEIKQEIMEDEYEYMNMQDQHNPSALEQLITEYKSDPPEHVQDETQELEQPKPLGTKPTMCRNFVRGTCKKGAACIFTHELIISQLPGVYTFCRNFQNRECTFTRCKFVHATVFEKENFYRTGYLPPHTVAHLKPVQGPPPPPPPEEPPADEVSSKYYPVMDMNTGTNVTEMSAMSGIPENYMVQSQMQNVNDIYASEQSTSVSNSTSPLKRNWDSNVTTDSSNYDQPERAEGQTVKKCKDCDANELRYQYLKNKVENMLTSADEMSKKTAHLNAKTQRLWTVLMSLFKPQTAGSQSGISGVAPGFGEKEKAIIDQLKLLVSTQANNGMSFMNEEDNMKNLLGGSMNFQNMLAKMFMNADQQSLP